MKMKAVIYEKYGSVEVLHLKKKPNPVTKTMESKWKYMGIQ